MNSQKSLLAKMIETIDQHRAERRSVAAPQEQRLSNLPRLVRWFPTPGNVLFTLLIAGLLVMTQHVWATPNLASVPGASATTVNYQGRVENSSGNPLSGAQNLEFAIYDASTSGNLIWGPESHTAVSVSEGLFSVGLGSQTSGGIPTTTWDGDRYLQITVNSETLTPREPIRSVPIAGMALTVPDGAINSSKVADNSLTNSDLAPSSVNSSELANNAVTSAKIQDGQVTNAKLNLNGLTISGDLTVSGKVIKRGQYTHVGAFEVPVEFERVVTTWTQVNKKSSLTFDWDDYNDYVGTNQQLYTRLCMSWSDSGGGTNNEDEIEIKIMKVQPSNEQYDASFDSTWSESEVIRHNCGAWKLTSTVSCGESFNASCMIEVDHTQDKNVFIEHIFMEVAVK